MTLTFHRLNYEDDSNELFFVDTIDEMEGTAEFCPANVAEPGNHYLSCGEKMTPRKDGSWNCKIHGVMH